MAIVVEEENRSTGNLSMLVTWGVVFVVLIVAVYYIFFKRPDLVNINPSADFQSAEQLSQVTLNPDAIVNSTRFKSLQTYAAQVSPSSGGRSNPFLGSF
jgi:hypothetical protein